MKILDWLENAVKIIFNSNQKKVQTLKAYFSPGKECVQTIINFIQSAKRKMDICVFTISDDKITEELIKSFKRGVDIRVITDDEKTFDMGSDIKELFQVGIQIKTDQSESHMHHKFAIFDQKSLLTGSYNWTRSASQYNQENIIEIHDEQMIKVYQKEFNHLWNEMVDYQ